VSADELRETPEQAALHLLQTALGAMTLFGAPSPATPEEIAGDSGCCGHGDPGESGGLCADCPGRRALFAAPAPHEPGDYTTEVLVAAACCGGFVGPGGVAEICTDCPVRVPRFLAPATVDDDLVEAGKAALGSAVCVRSSGPLTDGDYRAVGEFVGFLQGAYAADTAAAAAPAAPAFSAPAPPVNKPWQGDDLWRELTDAVRQFCLNDPRSQQTEIGPSEIGHPCDARVLRSAMGVERFNVDADPWASFVGKAVHELLARVFDAANRRLGVEQYLIERKVYVSEGVFGSCDLFRDGTVIDHKIMGVTSMKELERLGMEAKGGIYRVQLHSYGRGWSRAGVEVREVVIAAWPRSGFLDGLRIYREPYDEQVAVDALDRVARLTASALEPGVDCDQDAFWESVPVKPSKQCAFCPWYDPRQDPEVADRLHCGAGRLARASAP
jgi:hypothetical protein